MYILTDKGLGQVSTAIDLRQAVERNRYYSMKLGWYAHYDRINPLLGFTNYSPNEETFAQAVANWQQKQGLAVDGIIGPKTWNRMQAALNVRLEPSSPMAPREIPTEHSGTVPTTLPAVSREVLKALRAFSTVASQTPATIENALNIMKLVCQYLNIPWRMGYTILEHEGGVRLFQHSDGVMQTTQSARKSVIPNLPRELKLTLLGRLLSDSISDQELNRQIYAEFRGRLSVQIATGVQELKNNLVKFNGYIALALIAYNAGSGWAYYIATRGQAKKRPANISDQQWEAMCRVGATLLHQSPSQIQVAQGVWQCDANIPAWFSHIPVFDRHSNLQLIAYKYLRRINQCIREQKPSYACTWNTHKKREQGTGSVQCKLTRYGSLDKLYNPQLLQRSYYVAVQKDLPPIADDGLPLKAVGQQLEKVSLR